MTSNAQQPLPFAPCTSQHSVKEASVGIFISDAIPNVDEYASYVRGNVYLKENFPDFKVVYKIGDEYSIKEESNSTEDGVAVGFAIANLHAEDDPIRYFQALNEDGRQYFSFHERNYTRWAPFKAMFIQVMRSFQNLDSKLKLAGISLTYVDEYHWQENQPIDYNKIFIKGNEYLPSIFFDDGNTDAPLSTTLSLVKDFIKFRVRLSIEPIQEEEKQILRITHNAVNTDVKWDFNYLSSDDNDELSSLTQAAHELNKDLLKAILLPQVIDLINMQ